mmetsp:Transcript_16540/g.33700  ORF Transcript_16540/g.33700 Transcript_16540/m.33700 type:complete len:354 (-) Transcript_16540:39-1100(-)
MRAISRPIARSQWRTPSRSISSSRTFSFYASSSSSSSSSSSTPFGVPESSPLSPPSSPPSSHTHFGSQTVLSSEKAGLVGEVFSSVAPSYDVMNDVMSLGLHRLWKDHLVSQLSLPSTLSSLMSSNPSPTAPLFRHLDVAGGTGDVSFRSLNAMHAALGTSPRSPPLDPPTSTVTVCDINPDMLRVGEERAMELYGPANVERMSDREGLSSPRLSSSKPLSFWEGDAECLPFDSCTFDLYTITFGLRNVTDPFRALESAYDKLRPGSRIVVMEFSMPPNPIVRAGYDLYSEAIPPLGKAVADDEASYRYLVESIRAWYSPEELKGKMEEAGFVGVTVESLNMGVVCIHSGWKL